MKRLKVQVSLFDITLLEEQLKKLEDETVKDGFWQKDAQETGKVLAKIKQLKHKVEQYKRIEKESINLQELTELANLENDEEVAKDILKSTIKLENEIEKLELETLLSGKYDKNNAILTLHPGAGGRRHTSFASLEVLPEITDDVQIDINPDDLRIDTYRASGAGGQHINKTSSAVRITHIPTNIVVACQSERSQIQNRETAMRMLKSKLLDTREKEQKATIDGLKGEQKDIAWGSQIRSYVFCPYTLVKDHRTNFEVGNVESVMNGNIDGFIEAYLKGQFGVGSFFAL